MRWAAIWFCVCLGIELLSPSSVGSPGGMLRGERLRSISDLASV